MSERNSTEADRERVQQLDGMDVGQLTDAEMESFLRCMKDGLAARCFTSNGVAGLMGAAKVRYMG